MALWGLDVEQVRQLGSQLNNQADQIQQIVSTLTNTLNNTQWTGPDAQQFHSEWNGLHVTALRNVIQALHDAGGKAIANATAQESASQSM